ncbi:KUP/HAK/KT family potassium transporter [Spirosoma fluminis]
MSTHSTNKVSAAGLLIALGIIYGDIGTSPLYVLNAILKGKLVTDELILGSLSLVIWTLTLQTTLKYVVLTLRADNRGEGGIFSLYALVRRRRKWLVFPAIVGGASLLADGMITPPMSVTSAIEGLRNIESLHGITDYTIVGIVLGIISALFFLQQFGTASIGKLFGPVMSLWFIMLAALGLLHLADDISIVKAFNPYYGIYLLFTYPQGFWILGGVFLCTTGAEALYSDLGHCGRSNIQVSWVFVKICLILNYLGQGAWLLSHRNGQPISEAMIQAGFNPFYKLMPEWFLLIGIIIATSAAIIASQALISGSFTLINEAIRLNLWPKMRIKYPSEVKGQLYLPGINVLLFMGCCGIVLYFQKSTNMEAAYGLAITLCMLATTVLFANYLFMRWVAGVLVYLFLGVYLLIEGSFLVANLDKFPHGGYVALCVSGVLVVVMFVWFKARKIKNRYVEFVRLDPYIPLLKELSHDLSIPQYATHLVFLTSADNPEEIEHKIIYSILQRRPKRADIYWFVHVDTVDDPYRMDYKVEHIAADDIIRVEFILGFRVQPRLSLLFRHVVDELVRAQEVNIISRYESLERRKVVGDFTFVVTEKYLSQDNELPFGERLIMGIHFWLKSINLSEEKGFGLDTSNVVLEKFPLVVSPVPKIHLNRLFDK